MSNLINSLDATALALLVWNNKKKIPHNLRWVFFLSLFVMYNKYNNLGLKITSYIFF